MSDIIGSNFPIYSELLNDSNKSFEKLVNKFLDRVPEYINEIKLIKKGNDSSEIKQIFHNIKGVSGNYGYPQLYELCKKAERLSPNYTSAEFLRCVEDVIEVCQRIMMVRDVKGKADDC